MLELVFRFRPSGHTMDQLVQDFNTALDETAGSNSSSRSTTSRRKVSVLLCSLGKKLILTSILGLEEKMQVYQQPSPCWRGSHE